MSHYDTLGVPPDATPEQIRAAYRRSSSAAHPDREGGSTERQAAINRAWQVLGDPEARARYDATGDDRPASAQGEMAKELLVNLFRQLILADGHGWLEAAAALLADQHSEFQARATAAKERVAKLQRRRDKVTVKGGVDNLVHAVIDQAIADADHELQQLGTAIDVNRLAAVALANYETSEAPPAAVVVNAATINVGWGADFAGMWRP